MGKFAFIIHPLGGKADVARKYKLARYLPERWVDQLVKLIPPQVVSHITGVTGADGATAEGWFVGCPLTPRQFLELPEEYVLAKVSRAARIAQDTGARIVGLGAYTSVVGDAGVTVAKNVEIAVTTGNTYTVATAMEGTLQAGALMGIAPEQARAAVVGAAGSIGRVCSHLMAETAASLTLVGRDRQKLEAVREEIGRDTVTVSTDPLQALPQADLVITVTSAVDTVIEPEYLKPGAVVCDVARPRDVSRAVAERRPDVLVIEGGVVQVPGPVDFGMDFGFPPGTAYACMAETMLLALEERYECFSLGRELEVEKVREIRRLAQKHGFRLAGFRSFERAVTPEQIERTREAAAQARRAGTKAG